MSRIKRFAAVMILALTFTLGVAGPAQVGATCVYDAQIAAQQGVITDLQGRLAGADARTAIVLNAQIAARQAAVADMQAACN